MSPARQPSGNKLTQADLMQPPLGFPDSPIKLKAREEEGYIARRVMKFGSDVVFCDHAIGFRTSREIEGPYADYVGNQFDKPVLFSGPVIPEPNTSTLEEKWSTWLGEFKASSVINCAFGSENRQNNHYFSTRSQRSRTASKIIQGPDTKVEKYQTHPKTLLKS
jgi:hypothetical protein